MPNILKRLVMCALISCAMAAFGTSSAAAVPTKGTRTLIEAVRYQVRHVKKDAICREASGVRRKVIKLFGKRTPGRDICRYGIRGGKKPSADAENRYLQTLKRMIAPPPRPVVASYQSPVGVSNTTSSLPTGYSSSGGSGSLPACASESGTNYSTGPLNTNPKSRATGRYQITPGTAANYGCSLATPAGQDACARVIYANQGRSAWTNCGG